MNIILYYIYVTYLQGEIEIVDGDYGSTNIEIVLEKHGTTQTSIDNIVVNQTLFDIGHGTIFVLQLVGVSLKPSIFVLLFYRILVHHHQ